MTKAEIADKQAQQAPGAAEVHIPLPDPTWHPIALRWYESLAESGQSQFYEPSDWAVAQYVAEAMHRHLGSGERFGAQMLQSIMSGCASLMSCEADRRRLRLELQRPGVAEPTESLAVTAISEYKSRISG